VSPLYAFGYGLSYTKFAISEPKLTKKKINKSGTTSVRVEVKNTGKREGTEVVQLYIRDVVSTATRPVKELKAFKRVRLGPGESTTVAFDVTPEMLKFYDVNMKFVVEPGDFVLMVGNSSRDEDLRPVTLQVTA